MQPLKKQIIASDPKRNVWVSANAGTGKTHILINRLLRLILDGADPRKIVCITFTKAAASEMQSRIVDVANKWISANDEALRQFYYEISGEELSFDKSASVRKSLAKIQDNPEILKIQTIHSLCQSVLKSFPLEAGISPFFEILEESTADKTFENCWQRLIDLSCEPNNKDEVVFSQALDFLLARISSLTIEETIKSLLTKRVELSELFFKYGGAADYLSQLKNSLRVNSSVEAIINQIYLNNEADLKHLIEVCSAGIKTDIAFADKLRRFIKTRNYNDLKSAFYTTKDEPRATFVTKKIKENNPEALDKISHIAADIAIAFDKIADVNCYEVTKNFTLIYERILELYETEKFKEELLDYNDLLVKTADLLSNKAISEWVKYKLDGGVDHMLIDESQDTNRLQWQIIEAMTSEFFSGETAKNIERTIFVVGDEKQSIYSFQGADSNIFKSQKEFYLSLSSEQNVQNKLTPLTLETSFRSCTAILKATDELLKNPEVRNAVTKSGEKNETIEHIASRTEHFGRVEILPIIGDKPTYERNNEVIKWHLPEEYPETGEAKNKEKLAEAISLKVKELIDSNIIIPTTEKPVEPRDIMILLRKRDEILPALIKHLQKHNISVAGMDRLKLNKNLAVKDLITLMKFKLLPYDDLNLACVLKGPLFNFSEEQLFEISWNRGQKSLWQSLQEASSIDEGEGLDKVDKGKAKDNKYNVIYQKSYIKLQSIYNSTDNEKPAEFLFNLLDVEGAREVFVACFGKQVNEILDELINVVVDYEEKNSPSMEKFVMWFDSSEIEVKRNLESNQNDLRIMTIHGSKGLQAPIVIIADSTTMADDNYKFIINDELFLCPTKKEYSNNMFESLKEGLLQESYDEYLRLLYVAMTRARDELYIFGYIDFKGRYKKEENWYNLVKNAVNHLNFEADEVQEEEIPIVISDEAYERYRASGAASVKEEVDAPPALPEFYLKKYKSPAQINFISPSELYERGEFYEDSDNKKPSEFANTDFSFGLLVHKLLEVLPDYNEKKREALIKLILSNYPDMDEYKKQEAILQAKHILSDPPFRFIFTENTKSEVPVSGFDDEGNFISGQIDRLVFKDDEVIIIDYKTNYDAEGKEDEILKKYQQQLEAYLTLLKKIYPQKKVSAALLFTASKKLVYL